MAGTITTGLKLGYKTSSSASSYTDLTNLMEIPEIGNTAKEKIDVTVLSDTAKKSIDGLGDTAQELTFKFLYEDAQFDTLAALNNSIAWQVTLPGTGGMTASFTGTPTVKLDGVGTNAAFTYSLTISVDSLITFA